MNNKYRCFAFLCILFWCFFSSSHATILKVFTNIREVSTISCDSAMQHCLVIKSLSKKTRDWSVNLGFHHAVYATYNGGRTWEKVAILDPLPAESMDGPISIGNMKMHCNNYGTCLLAGIVELNAGFRDIVTYVTNDSGLHWNGPELLHIAQTKVVNIIDLSCNQVGEQCQILIQNGWFEPPVIYKTEDLGKTWSIHVLPKEPVYLSTNDSRSFFKALFSN